jgi:hypothetical protein
VQKVGNTKPAQLLMTGAVADHRPLGIGCRWDPSVAYLVDSYQNWDRFTFTEAHSPNAPENNDNFN